MRNTRPLEIPLEWHGLELHAPLARMKSGQASLAMTAKASMAEGWPVGLVIEAREAPAAWFVEWTGLDPGERLQGPSVNMDMQAGLLAKAPSVWATTGRTEITAVDVPKPLQQLWQDLQVPGMDSLDGNFRASVQWQGRNGGTDVQQFQVLAGGILLGGRAVVLPGGVVRGQMGVAVAPDVGEAITRLESRLPPELAFHIEAPQEVTLPEGRKESWKGRAVTLTGLLTDLRLALWPGQAPVSPVEIRQAVLSRRLPADPDEIELLPMRNRNR